MHFFLRFCKELSMSRRSPCSGSKVGDRSRSNQSQRMEYVPGSLCLVA